jgi:hypothetical protein
MLLRYCTLAANDLQASDGRDTEALNCKPITNLKEISKLSNYCKPAAFVCMLLGDVLNYGFILTISLSFITTNSVFFCFLNSINFS